MLLRLGWRISRAAVALVVVLLPCRIGHAQCEPSQSVRAVLNQARLVREAHPLEEDTYAERVSILENGLKRYHDDYFLLRARMFAEPNQEAQMQWAAQDHKEHSSQPVYALVFAESLVKRKTPEALRLLETLSVVRPVAAQAYLQLADNHYWGKLKDPTKLQADLDGFLKLCPATLDADALGIIVRSGSTEQMSRVAAPLRVRLQNATDPVLLFAWETLWNLELKTKTVTQHDQVKAQIVQDLAKLQRLPKAHEVQTLIVLLHGNELLGNIAEKERIGDSIVQDYPLSKEAKQIIEERWDRQHHLPASATKTERDAFYRTSLVASEEEHRRWPKNAYILYRKLDALTLVPDTDPEQIAKTSDELLDVDAEYSGPPAAGYIRLVVATAYVKAKLRLDQVPALVEGGYKLIMKNEDTYAHDDRLTADGVEGMAARAAYFAEWRAGILLDYFELTKDSEKVRALDNELQAFDPPSSLKSFMLQLHAHAAKIEGRKLDALFLYRSAVAAQKTPVMDDDEDSAAWAMKHLWTELGGTAATYQSFVNGAERSQSLTGDWERPAHPLPAFSLPDSHGKTWTVADWSGKTVVINIWATWCPPCREELPLVEKFYKKTKERNDVALISFNVDDDITKVAPYLQENGYTFPVFLARDIVHTVSEKGYPQTWLVDRRGSLEWILTNFDPKWLDVVNAKIEEMQREAK